MKPFCNLFWLLPALLSAQTSVQKGPGNILSNGSIVVGNNTSITTTGSGQIVATGGTASSLPWSGLTSIPSPTITFTGDATGSTLLLASGGASSTLTLSSVITSGTVGSGSAVPIVTYDAKGRIIAASSLPLVSDTATTVSGASATLTPTSVIDTQRVTLGGSAGSRVIAVSTSNAVAGARCDLLFGIPATSGLVVTVKNANLGGTTLQSFTTTGTTAITSARLTLEFDGSQWQPIFYQGPIP